MEEFGGVIGMARLVHLSSMAVPIMGFEIRRSRHSRPAGGTD